MKDYKILKKRALRIYQVKPKIVLDTGEVMLLEDLVPIPEGMFIPHRIPDN